MEVIETSFEGLKVIKPNVYRDNRGRFYEHWQEKRYYDAVGGDISFVQDDFSISKKNVLRGLHGQKGQCKLIETVVGKVWDVLVDIRPNSKTYKQYFSIYLSEDEPTQVFAPDGFIHGFCVLSDYAVMHYKCSTCHDKTLEYGYRYNDPTFNVNWPVLPFILSAKDNKQPFFIE
jgi:dTDP-4-dehydrorhamnose 3,5-epimerase